MVTRTDHRSFQMIALYRRQAKTAAEAKLGWFELLYEVIPELAALGDEKPSSRAANKGRRRAP